MNEDTKDLMLDLLIKQEIYGLEAEEAARLRELGASSGGSEAFSIGLTAAALSLVELDTTKQLPTHLEARISDAGEEYLDSLAMSVGPTVADRPRTQGVTTPDRGTWFNWLGWIAAAAACVALGINMYTTRQKADVARVETPVEQRPTVEQMRQRLMESSPDITKAELAGGKGFENVVGDAIWSDVKQAGYLRFRGLPVNDKSKETYQLWIFDETQDEKTPIDGGTFDIDRNGEVVIPITAKLTARNPKAFAVTVEKPGGVVVSKREKVAAIGKTSA